MEKHTSEWTLRCKLERLKRELVCPSLKAKEPEEKMCQISETRRFG
jgi:hypothetical protein